MFGLGFGKLLLLVAVVAAVWYGFKLFGRRDEQRARRRAEKKKQDTDSIGKMEPCPVCGTYVVAAQARNCGREGCPY